VIGPRGPIHTPGPTDLRAVRPEDFEALHPLLLQFSNPRMTREDWRRLLFDLAWSTDEPTRGYALFDGPRAVGFLGAIPSTRTVSGRTRRFINLSSWLVEEPYRAESLKLVLPLLADKGRTIVNLSPSPQASEIFTRLGFQALETEQVLVPLVSGVKDLVPRVGVGVRTRLDRIREALDPPGQALLDDMKGTQAGQALLTVGDHVCHVIATRSPWKAHWRLAHVQYASDWDLFWRHPARVAGAFLRVFGTMGLRVDGRHVRGPLPAFSVRKALPLPHLFRPEDAAVTPELVDGLYTEAVGLRW
jgi:hypothetical protein